MHSAPWVYILPNMDLPYYRQFAHFFDSAGVRVTFSSKFPLRGIFFDDPPMAIHLHMLDVLFKDNSTVRRAIKILWFRFAVIPALKFRRIPLVWTCHELLAHEDDPHNVGLRMAGIIARSADAIIVHNSSMRDRLSAAFPKAAQKIKIAPHGELTSYYDRLTKSKCSPPRDKVVFASVGYMRENKGNDLILRAFSMLKDPNARLIMSGNCNDPAYRDVLENLALRDTRVVLKIKHLSVQEVVDYHTRASVAVFGFRDCPTSGSVITALSLGCPIIGPSIGHLAELVNHRTGWLFENTENPELGLLACMEQAILNRNRLSRMGDIARSRQARVAWPDIIQLTLDVYRSARRDDWVQKKACLG